ncbi:hypothetical protein [Pelagibacterium sp.]|uniref:hypothetical protein n=1 Tax=Pelagibacterium sp. TaxID=1967288 RepID=UPI003C7EC984
MRRPAFPTRVPASVAIAEPLSRFVDGLVDYLNDEGDVVVPEGVTAAEPALPSDEDWDDPYGERRIEQAPRAADLVEAEDEELPEFLFAETFGEKR